MPITKCVANYCRKRKKSKLLKRSDSEGSEDDESEKKRQFHRSFHSFPTDKAMKDQWVANMIHQRKDWYPSEHSRICSDHFFEKFIDRDEDANKVTLKPDAQPTRFKAFKKETPRKYIRKIPTKWNVISMMGAMNAVLNKKLACKQAADIFDVPKTTLMRLIEKYKIAYKAEQSTQDYPTNSKVTPRSNSPSETHDDSPAQPSPTKLQKKSERQMVLIESIVMDTQPSQAEMQKKQDLKVAALSPPPVQPNPNQTSSKRKAAAQSTKVSSQIKILKHLQNSTSLPTTAQPASTKQIIVEKPKTAKTSRVPKKRLLVVSNHQQCVMSSLASLWKSGKFCDAGLCNGSTTVKVHKVVLSAVCPKLLTMFSEDFISQNFLQVNFPKEVTKAALMAFGEYIYRGVLYLNKDILEQLKIIAKRLDNQELGKLCDRHLHSNKTEPAASLTNFSSVQTAPPTNFPSVQTAPPTNFPSVQTASPTNFPSVQKAPSTNFKKILRQETSLVSGQKVQMITVGPNWSAVDTDHVGNSTMKAEIGIGHNQSSVSVYSSKTVAASSSKTVAESSFIEEFTIPFSKRADVDSTKSKDPDSYETPVSSPISNVAEKVCSDPVNIDGSETSSRSSEMTSLVGNPLTGDEPVELSTAGGNILPLKTEQTTDHRKPELYEMDLT